VSGERRGAARGAFEGARAEMWETTRKQGGGRAARARRDAAAGGASLERTLSAMNSSLPSPSAMVAVRAPPALYPDALPLRREGVAQKVVAWTPQSLRIAFFP
jgi:hypothetical protein